MIKLKTENEIEMMRNGGKILKEIMQIVLNQVKEGIMLSELDEIAEKEILKRGASPSFKRVKGYKWTICSCVNNVVVHGIPNDYRVKNGDVVGIDCGVYYQGFHTDSSWTVYLSKGQSEEKNKIIENFIDTGKEALRKAILTVKKSNYIYDISKTIEDTVVGNGYSVVSSLVGHGVGRDLHEDPEIPGVVGSMRTDTPQITEGMVLAVEVIYNLGKKEIVYDRNDGWTISTKDGKISGLFEATVAMSSHGCIVLT